MRIDAHFHVNFNGFSAEGVIRYLDEHRLDKCWLMTWEEVGPVKWIYENLSIGGVFETFLHYPGRIIPMYAPDPFGEGACDKLRQWKERGIRGCAELKTAMNWDDPLLENYLETVSELGFPLLFHMQESAYLLANFEADTRMERLLVKILNSSRLFGLPGRVVDTLASSLGSLKLGDYGGWKTERRCFFPGYMLDFASLAAVLTKYPLIRFVGHGPYFWRNICKEEYNDSSAYPKGKIPEEGLLSKLLREHHNLFADISGGSGYNAIRRDQVFSKKFIDEFSDRVIFGSDNSGFDYEGFLKSLGLNSETMRRIFGENAERAIEPSLASNG